MVATALNVQKDTECVLVKLIYQMEWKENKSNEKFTRL